MAKEVPERPNWSPLNHKAKNEKLVGLENMRTSKRL